MQMDADGQHKPEYIAPMLAALEEGNDIVIGSRFLAVKKPKTLRMLGSYIISWSIRLTTAAPSATRPAACGCSTAPWSRSLPRT